MVSIRPMKGADWPAVWTMIEPVFRAGETYAFSPTISETAAQEVWIKKPRATYVAHSEQGTIVGTYYIKPNQPALGSHVCKRLF